MQMEARSKAEAEDVALWVGRILEERDMIHAFDRYKEYRKQRVDAGAPARVERRAEIFGCEAGQQNGRPLKHDER